MRKFYRLGAIACLFLASSLCSAGEWGLWEHVDGRPHDFQKGDVERYGVWHVRDGDKWHLVATTAGHKHHFKGEIVLEGPGHFNKIEEWKGEGEKWNEKENHNWFHNELTKKHGEKKIEFDIVAEGGESGVTFETDKCGNDDEIKWELFFGGDKDHDECKSMPEKIFVGEKGEHPEHGRFKTWCHPDEKHKGH